MKSLDCSFEAVVGRKICDLYETKHNGNESEFYADMLSHLLKNKLGSSERLVLNIAQRGKTTRNAVLESALQKAINSRKTDTWKVEQEPTTKVVFNVQHQHSEPLLNIADYFCWAIQRVFERGEMRYYEYLSEKMSLIVDIYDKSRWEENKNYYNSRNPLTNEQNI